MAISELAKERDEFFVMSADLGNSSGLAKFQGQFPNRFINLGIAEQNMVGVAGGMAKDGTPIFATSFAPFIAMRACEQVRMNMGYMQLNIKAVALGAGLIMAQLGNSHFGLEDVAVMCVIQNIAVVSPTDCVEIVKAVSSIADYKGPVYLRLTGGINNPIVYSADYDFTIGQAITLREGTDVAIVAAGTMVHQSLMAADVLAAQGITATVIDMHTIKPLDTAAIDSLLAHKLIATVEEHSVIGGLGSAVAEYLAPLKQRPPQLIIGINDTYPHTGSYEYLLKECGLTAEQIADKIKTGLFTAT